MNDPMSLIGSSISQSVAGSESSERAAAKDLARKAGRTTREAARAAPDADALIVSPDAIARASAMNNNADQPSSQRHRTLGKQHEQRQRNATGQNPPAEAERRPLDLQG